MPEINDDITIMKNLGLFNSIDISNNKIEYRKKIMKVLAESRNNAKLNECYYCGKPCTSFCNSHSIPRAFLSNIAINGEVYCSNKFVNMPLIDMDKGVQESGTFHLICRECDSTIFRDYEKADNYENTPTMKMLAQIALKNYLKSISKRLFEIALYDNMADLTKNPLFNEYIANKQNINKVDLGEFIFGYKRAVKAGIKSWNDEYYLFCYEKLNYVVPIAFQSNITLLSDFDDNIINDIYNYSTDYHTEDIHICVFPLKDSSIVMIFIDSKSKRYRKFCKQFRQLSLEDRLTAINYIIFCYSEDVFIYKNIDPEIINNQKLVEASQKNSDALTNSPQQNPIKAAIESYSFSKMHDIPNLLLEKYKIR